MDKKNDLSEKLLKENGSSTVENIDALIEGIHQKIRKEKSKLVQMKWITIGLWIGTLFALYIHSHLKLNSGNQVNYLKIFIYFMSQLFPMAAFFSTLFLLLRNYSFSRKEINLRLSLIEAQLLRQEQGERSSRK